MTELTTADYSLLAWIQRAGVSAHSFSIRFHLSTLVVHCQNLEEAMKLWEARSCLQWPGYELCFRVNGTFYVEATLG